MFSQEHQEAVGQVFEMYKLQGLPGPLKLMEGTLEPSQRLEGSCHGHSGFTLGLFLSL